MEWNLTVLNNPYTLGLNWFVDNNYLSINQIQNNKDFITYFTTPSYINDEYKKLRFWIIYYKARWL